VEKEVGAGFLTELVLTHVMYPVAAALRFGFVLFRLPLARP
jgi:hypothetical protein